MHNESVNVWSHFLGMVFFASLIFTSVNSYAVFKVVGASVQSGLHQAKAENLHLSSYFHSQLKEIESDLDSLYHISTEGKGEYLWGARLQSAVHRIEGLAQAFVSELSHFKNYVVATEEQVLEDTFHQWTAHVQHFPEELKRNIALAQSLIAEQYANGTSVLQLAYENFGISNKTYSRVRLFTD